MMTRDEDNDGTDPPAPDTAPDTATALIWADCPALIWANCSAAGAERRPVVGALASTINKQMEMQELQIERMRILTQR